MKAKRAHETKRPEDINAALAQAKGPVSQFIARNYRHFNGGGAPSTRRKVTRRI